MIDSQRIGRLQKRACLMNQKGKARTYRIGRFEGMKGAGNGLIIAYVMILAISFIGYFVGLWGFWPDRDVFLG